jgi:hypothetical protein
MGVSLLSEAVEASARVGWQSDLVVEVRQVRGGPAFPQPQDSRGVRLLRRQAGLFGTVLVIVREFCADRPFYVPGRMVEPTRIELATS